MTTAKTIATRAIKLDRAIANLKSQLDALKDLLILEAEQDPSNQSETEGGGKSWQVQDAVGNIARVTFPAPTLKDKINGVGKTIEKIMQLAGKRFADLFEQVPAWKPKPEFRKLVDTQLDAVQARKLLKLCSTESAPRVSFETKEKQEG